MIAALVLIGTGLVGMAVVSLGVGSSGVLGVGSGSFTSSGQRIYYTGADANGPIPRTAPGSFGMMGYGMMGAVACVDCHGQDGRGGRVGTMFGALEIPDIRYATLTTPRSENATTVPAWTDADIARAIREGVEPNGQQLQAPMPRWQISDADVNDVIAYLKELNRP